MTKQQRAYELIRDRIVSGSYRPGARILVDAVAADLGCSALPVREAIRRLEAEGLVVHRPHAGARVAPTEPGRYEDELAVVAVLEGHATALAAPYLTARDFASLEAIVDRMVAAMERMDVAEFGRQNAAFHEHIYGRCPNPVLVEMTRDAQRRLDAIRTSIFFQIPYRGAASIKEHRMLIALMRDGEPARKIETAARDHKLKTLDVFRRWRLEHEVEDLSTGVAVPIGSRP